MKLSHHSPGTGTGFLAPDDKGRYLCRRRKKSGGWLMSMYHLAAQLSCTRSKTLLLDLACAAAMVFCKPEAAPMQGCQPISFSALLQSKCMRANADLTR